MTHHHAHSHSHQPNYRTDDSALVPLVKLATLASLSIATLLLAAKLVAWLMTDSLSLLSSLIDSGMDVLTSGINFMVVRYALQPADEEHRFGHGRAEDIAGLAQATFISGTGLFILVEGLERLFHPVAVEHTDIGLWVMVASMVATTGLVAFQRYVIRKTQSVVVAADSLHYLTDILSNFAVIVALLLSSHYGLTWADPVLALLIAAYILHSAWGLGQTSFQKLMDREFSEEERQEIIALVEGHAGVLGFHDLRTRQAGMTQFIQMHVDLDGTQTLHAAHEIADALEKKLQDHFPRAEIFIHQDPQ